MSPTTFAKPIMCTSTPLALPSARTSMRSVPWIWSRTRASSVRATLIGSMARPSASSSSTIAETSAPEKSFATSRPTMPAFRMFSRTSAMPSGVGVKSAGTTLPASMPSSTTSR
jgi:hypothetical protein